MPLTHDEIAAMTRDHDWSHAGRLLEMMAVDCVAVQVIHISAFGNWTVRYEKTPKTDGDICFTAPTPPEAIARCWLEWWEVTHE